MEYADQSARLTPDCSERKAQKMALGLWAAFSQLAPIFDNCRNQVSMTDISVTTKHENGGERAHNGIRPLCDQARIMAMVWLVEPANQVELDAVGTAK